MRLVGSARSVQVFGAVSLGAAFRRFLPKLGGAAGCRHFFLCRAPWSRNLGL